MNVYTHHQDSRESLVRDAAERAGRYLSAMDDRAVAPTQEALDALSYLGGPLPHRPTDAATVLDMLDTFGSPATIASAGGRYFGFVNGGALPAALAAKVLASAWDQNAAIRAMSPVAVHLEQTALGWMRELLRLPEGTASALVSGATMANLGCLAAARHALLARQGWDVESQGLFGAPPIRVITSAESHVSVGKALAILGLGKDRVHKVPTDDQGRLRVDLLPEVTEPTIVCLQAGNLNTGSFDPIAAVCEALPRDLTWVHVDGAIGLWAAVSNNHRHLLEGYEAADSWATDGHKLLNLPYDCGMLFVRHAEALHAAMSSHAPYLQTAAQPEPLQCSPEMSRRARGVEAWAAVKSLGREGIANLMDNLCRHARRFDEALRDCGFEVRNDVVLNQVLVSFGSDEETKEVIAAIQQDGVCWCGGTVWAGRHAMRISVASWATTDEDVERSLEAILRAAARCGVEPLVESV